MWLSILARGIEERKAMGVHEFETSVLPEFRQHGLLQPEVPLATLSVAYDQWIETGIVAAKEIAFSDIAIPDDALDSTNINGAAQRAFDDPEEFGFEVDLAEVGKVKAEVASAIAVNTETA